MIFIKNDFIKNKSKRENSEIICIKNEFYL